VLRSLSLLGEISIIGSNVAKTFSFKILPLRLTLALKLFLKKLRYPYFIVALTSD
jgi:hypothetical protein